MAYILNMDGTDYPITPSKIQTTIKNQNKTINIINENEINILKAQGLTEFEFDLLLPSVQYPFAIYPNNTFRLPEYYLNKLKEMKTNKKNFRFMLKRQLPTGTTIFDTDFDVSLEDYRITDDVQNGFDILVNIKLKEYKAYGVKNYTIKENTDGTKTATVEKTRTAQAAPSSKTHTVVKGDTLRKIAKKYYGNSSEYKTIVAKNKIKNPNLIYPGQVFIL